MTGDTIHALIFVAYGSYGPGYRITYFTGQIKNKDTIVNWREVLPYHRTRPPSNPGDQFSDELDRVPQLLTFLPFADKVNIDSTKPWVNKYRR